MKATVMRPVEVEITTVEISVAVRYGDEDIPFDFPLRNGDMWNATVDADTGKINNWPQGKAEELYMKVCDCGTYRLLGPDNYEVGSIVNDYVPHGVVPGEYGDYISLKIDENGVITNWPKKLDVASFFTADEA